MSMWENLSFPGVTGKSGDQAAQSSRISETEEIKSQRKELIYKLADTVSICGIKEMVTEDFPHVRFMFALGLILTTTFGIYESVRIVQDHLTQKKSISIDFGQDDSNYFPNITLCSTGLPNTDKIRKTIRNITPDDVKRGLSRLGLNEEDFLNDISKMQTLIYNWNNYLNTTFMRYKLKILDAAVDRFRDGFAGWVRFIVPSCPEFISYCTLNDVPFDCCNFGQYLAKDGQICYQLGLNDYDRNIFSKMNQAKNGFYHRRFQVDAQFDWAIADAEMDSVTDGFLVNVAEQFHMMTPSPIAIAPGWNAFIRLAQVAKVHDITKCAKENFKCKYFSYYDDYGVNCALGEEIDSVEEFMRCKLSMGTYIPEKEEGCTMSQVYAIRSLLLVEGLDDETQKAIFKAYKPKAVGYARGELCQPKCTRWQYLPLVSYAERSPSGQFPSPLISTSRITITMADQKYEERYEQEQESFYILLANMSGVMGTCIGLSIITIAQFIAYAVHICCTKDKMKKNKISPIWK